MKTYVQKSTGNLVEATRFDLTQEQRDAIENEKEVKFLEYTVTKLEGGVGSFIVELAEDGSNNLYEGEWLLVQKPAEGEEGKTVLLPMSDRNFSRDYVTKEAWDGKECLSYIQENIPDAIP